MSRCYISKCCCGCTDLKAGINIMTAIDLMFYFGIFGIGLATGQNGWRAFRWAGLALLILIADIILLIGVATHNVGLITFWLSIKMINIIILFIGWIVVPLTAFIPHVKDVEERSQVFEEVEIVEYIIWSVALLVLLILPNYYIYYWIVVNSYRKTIMSLTDQFTPVVGGIGHVFVVSDQSPHGIYGQPSLPAYQPAYGQPVTDAQPPPPMNLYGVQGANGVTYPGGTETVQPPSSAEK